MTHLEAYSDALLALAWEALAYFPTFWGNVLRGTIFIAFLGISCIAAATLFASIMWEAKRKQEERRGPVRKAHRARGRAVMRILLRPLARKQGKAKALSL